MQQIAWTKCGYSMTSSARASSVGGTSSPSAFATLRLIASSNLVGAWTGRSAGLAPPRMRSMYSAARGNVSPKSTPYETTPPSRAMNRNGYTAEHGRPENDCAPAALARLELADPDLLVKGTPAHPSGLTRRSHAER